MLLHTPREVFGDYLETLSTCPGCLQQMLVKDMVVYEGHYTQLGTLRWGCAAFCSQVCILRTVAYEGTA